MVSPTDRPEPGLLVQPGQLHRLGPTSTGNVYLLRVPAVLDRPVFRRELRRAGARSVSHLDLIAGLEAGLAAIAEQAGEPVPDEQLAAVAEHRADIERAYELLRQAPFDTSIDRDEAVRLLQAPPLVQAVEGVVREHWAAYRDLLADQEAYGEFAGIVAAQLFLRGWEGNLPAFTRRHDGGPDDKALSAIPLGDLLAIGVEVQLMMAPGPRTLGNSPSASGSAPVPTPSNSARKPPETIPSTTTSGTSPSSESPG